MCVYIYIYIYIEAYTHIVGCVYIISVYTYVLVRYVLRNRLHVGDTFIDMTICMHVYTMHIWFTGRRVSQQSLHLR